MHEQRLPVDRPVKPTWMQVCQDMQLRVWWGTVDEHCALQLESAHAGQADAGKQRVILRRMGEQTLQHIDTNAYVAEIDLSLWICRLDMTCWAGIGAKVNVKSNLPVHVRMVRILDELQHQIELQLIMTLQPRLGGVHHTPPVVPCSLDHALQPMG